MIAGVTWHGSSERAWMAWGSGDLTLGEEEWAFFPGSLRRGEPAYARSVPHIAQPRRRKLGRLLPGARGAVWNNTLFQYRTSGSKGVGWQGSMRTWGGHLRASHTTSIGRESTAYFFWREEGRGIESFEPKQPGSMICNVSIAPSVVVFGQMAQLTCWSVEGESSSLVATCAMSSSSVTSNARRRLPGRQQSRT
eukprot:3635451-Rhodomonas_salina.2